MTRFVLLAAGIAIGWFARRCTDAYLELRRDEDPQENADA